MEKLMSIRRDLESVPDSYILPPDSRPGETEVPLCKTIPVIDCKGEFGRDPTKLIQQIIEASTEFGLFQLINHGVEEKLLQDALKVAKEFFGLPDEDKAILFSDDPKKSCRLYTSIDYMKEEVHYWRDSLRHPCHPLEEHRQFWPEKPAQYRDVMGSYSAEVRKLSLYLLDMICDGLGLEPGYFRNSTQLTEVQLMAANHYPPCPDPSLTLGLPKHGDFNLITILLQEMDGLQVLKDGQWLAVEPLPNAFVVNIGHTLQIISNGKLKSAEHRVVTNRKLARTTVTSFIAPSNSCQIEPAKELVKKFIPPLYRAFTYKDFLATYVTDTYQRKPPLERYKFQI
ncbi:Hyoscyamine 6-dioxygenase [Morus notabilis]|uniref:Hyoscyamine 6-dioxygenase n=1 Tax=Morus notabilis TaxID=981085 RepID=W9S991_9ROSA|nr:hyoscyamine 6-dioxygenase [Morus notabilis]EXC31935.1 Hyoscyamine 6-dioxygenase [Morus notabilis]